MGCMSAAALSHASLAELLATGGPRAVYQPIVTLPQRRVVAYEALARGPVGSHTLVEDRELVLQAARSLMLRIAGRGVAT